MLVYEATFDRVLCNLKQNPMTKQSSVALGFASDELVRLLKQHNRPPTVPIGRRCLVLFVSEHKKTCGACEIL